MPSRVELRQKQVAMMSTPKEVDVAVPVAEAECVVVKEV